MKAREEKARPLPLRDFFRDAWRIIEPGTLYLDNWHIDAIADHLEAVESGQIRRLIINIAPRYGKSIPISVMFPCWWWTKKPSEKMIFCSYSADLSDDMSVKRRRIIESEWYGDRWGGTTQLSADMNLKSKFQNVSMGVMQATSIGGTVMGMGGNLIVIDDPTDPRRTDSDPMREDANRYFDGTLYGRLDDKINGAIVLVQQRLHENDMTGHLVEKFAKDRGFAHLNLPVIAEEESDLFVSYPHSGREHVRELGDILWPEREGPPEIDMQREILGEYNFAGQYQQKPSPKGGGIIKEDWWRYYTETDLPTAGNGRMKFDSVVQSWDCTFKDTKNSDDVCGQVWGKFGADYYLLDMICRRMDFPTTIKAVRRMVAKWPETGPILIEDKANGPAVIASLAREIEGIIAVNPEGSKEARVHSVTHIIQAGNVHLPDRKLRPDVTPFLVGQASRFPRGAKDDAVDSLAQAIKWLSARGRQRYFGNA